MRRLTRLHIAHVDLSAPVEFPALPAGHDGVYAFFWWRGLPLGHRLLDAPSLPHDDAAFARLAFEAAAPAVDHYAGAGSPAWRAALDAAATPAAGPGTTLDLAVVVPTCGRPERLARCLASIRSSAHRPAELVVVDNTEGSAETAAAAARYEARYVVEPRRGSSAARNAGLAATRSPLVAFADDDETVHPDWMARLCEAFDDPAVAVVTGLVMPSELETEAQVWFERRYGFMRGFTPRRFDAAFFAAGRRRGVPTWEVGGSGNMAVRRGAFVRMGGFDERLGAGTSGGGEDLESYYRALALGYVCRYEPRAVTYHAHRRDDDGLRRQLHAYMRGHVSAFLAQYARHRDARNLYHVFATLPRTFAGYAYRALRGDPACRPDTLWPELTGYASGIAYFARHLARPAAAAPARGATPVLLPS